MQGALKISWGSAVRGREAKALEVFGRSLEYFDELAKAGRISGYRTYLSVSGRAACCLSRATSTCCWPCRPTSR